VPKRYLPDDPREWLNRAHSNLAMAKVQSEDIYLEDLCFHAQQAVEHAIKALLIKHAVEYPYIHDIARLLTLLEDAGLEIPDSLREAERLTIYAVITRYPGVAPPVKLDDYQQAIAVAQQVLCWIDQHISAQG